MFDLQTEIRNKQGIVVQRQYYKRYVSAEFGEYYERDGKFYAPNGAEIENPRAEKKTAAASEVEAPKTPAGTKPKAGTVETLTTK